MTRVMLVIPALSPEAGAESSTAAVLPFLRGWGVDLHVVVLTASQGLVPEVESAGIAVHDLSGQTLVRQVIELRSLVKTLEPDLVHSTLFQASTRSQVATLATKVRSLVTWANTPTDPRTELAATWKLRLVYLVEMAFAHLPNVRFHAVTEGVALTKARSLHVRHDKVKVAERGRDASRYRQTLGAATTAWRAALGIADADRVLLAVGRQEPQKGYVDLVRAFDMAAGDDPAIRLVIAGRSGSASAEINDTVASVRHGDRIHLLGHRADVGDLLGLADAIVCASYREGAAGALIEAMASGTPILSIELDGLIGVLEDGVNALVVSRSELADGIRRTFADRAAAAERALAASAMFERQFTIERSAEALLRVYQWAIDGRGDQNAKA